MGQTDTVNSRPPILCAGRAASMAERRKTLAGVENRQSLAPGRVVKPATGAGLDKAMARLSLAGPVQRRSSTYTAAKGAPGVKQDPRPVSDKGFQANCGRVIITYLAAHGYEHPITPKVPYKAAHAWDLLAMADGLPQLDTKNQSSCLCPMPLRMHSLAGAAPHSGWPQARCSQQGRSRNGLAAPAVPAVPTHRPPAGPGQPHHQGLCQHRDLPLPPGGPPPQCQAPG